MLRTWRAQLFEASDDEVLTAVRGAMDAVVTEPSGEFQESDRYHCEICNNPIPPGQSSKWGKFGFSILDRGLFNALHCFQRATGKDANLQKKVRTLIIDEPLKFRNMVLKLVAPPRQRKRAQVLSTLELVSVMIEERSKVRKQKQLLMNRRQFIAWHCMHEGFSKEEAADRWLEDKGRAYSEMVNGKLCVAVDMPLVRAHRTQGQGCRRHRS